MIQYEYLDNIRIIIIYKSSKANFPPYNIPIFLESGRLLTSRKGSETMQRFAAYILQEEKRG